VKVLLLKLHWLPVSWYIKYKLAKRLHSIHFVNVSLAVSALRNHRPDIPSPSRSLRSIGSAPHCLLHLLVTLWNPFGLLGMLESPTGITH